MYAKIINSTVEQYPFYIQTLKQENPNTSFPNNIEMDYATLKEYNIFRVFETSQPEYDPKSQHIQETTPIFNNERWERAWKVVDLSQEEVMALTEAKAQEVRSQRNYLLQETDWTQARDIPEQISLLWQPYRQALRDVTSQEGFPYSVTWPVKPE